MEAGELLDRLLVDMPEAVKAALAVWVLPELSTDAFERCAARLPAAVESGPMPTQAQADAWADRHTLGVIRAFPADLRQMSIVLASAIATRVSWEEPFGVAPADERFSHTSPWLGAVDRVLCTRSTGQALIAHTSAAGVVAVHQALAREDLTVICVSAEPAIGRCEVLSATHELAPRIAAGEQLHGCSLFDLPVGDGHSWVISERERPAWVAGQRFEEIVEVALPAWELETRLDLLSSDSFGARAAIDMPMLIAGPGPREAQQVARATFDRYGFEAAALTMTGVTSAGIQTLPAVGLERTARLRFDHPFAALAVAGRPSRPSGRFRGLPLFEAWIQTPVEADPAKPE